MPDDSFVLRLTADLTQIEAGLAKLTGSLAKIVASLEGVDGALEATGNAATRTGGKFAGMTAEQIASAKQLEISSKQTALYNQYLYDEAKAADKAKGSLSNARYALYDVASGLATAGAAFIALSVAPAILAANFQRDFANVQRTVQGAGSAIEQSLIDLSQQIPVGFKDLTEIAALGGQLGIAKSGIIDFTKTVAELTATTNLSADVAGTALGRFQSFGLVTASQFGNLASAILKVGVNSVATESQITTIGTRIAGIAKVAGLSAPTIIGFAGALASVGVQPYAASGTTTRLISDIQKAVQSGGPDLEEFAKIAGTSADTLSKAFGTSKFNPIFQSLISNLGNTKRTGTDVRSELDKLGISSVTDVRTLTQLAAASGTVKQAFSDATSGFANTSTLTSQYGKIAVTTSSQIKILGNTFEDLVAGIGKSTTGPINVFIGGLTNILKTLQTLADNPVGSTILTIASAFGVVAGVLLLVAAGAVKGVAGIAGMITSLQAMNAQGIGSVGILGTLRAELAATGAAGTVASKGIGIFTAAAKGIAAAGIVVALSQLAGGLLNLEDNAKNNSIGNGVFSKNTTTSINAIQKYAKSVNLAAIGLDTYNKGIGSLAIHTTGANGALTQTGSGFKAIDDILGGLPGRFSGVDQAREAVDKIDTSLADLVKGGNAKTAAADFNEILTQAQEAGVKTGDFADQFTKYNKALKDFKVNAEAASKVNKDLLLGQAPSADTFSKALSSSSGLSAKDITSFSSNIGKQLSALTSVTQAINDLQSAGSKVDLSNVTKQLNDNTAVAQTFLSESIQIAQQFGPDVAATLEAAGPSVTTNSIMAQLLKASPAQAQAYIDATNASVGSAAAAAGQTLIAAGGLVTTSGGKIGADTADQIGKQLLAGFSPEQIMAEFNLRFASAPPVIPAPNTDAVDSGVDADVKKNSARVIKFGTSADLSIADSDIYGFINKSRPPIVLRTSILPGHLPDSATGAAAGNATGGPIYGPGTSTSDSIPARLSNGEFVIRAASVSKFGAGFFDSLNRGRMPRQFASGGAVGPSPSSSVVTGVMELGPVSLNAVRQIAQQEVYAVISQSAVGQAANAYNQRQQKAGAK